MGLIITPTFQTTDATPIIRFNGVGIPEDSLIQMTAFIYATDHTANFTRIKLTGSFYRKIGGVATPVATVRKDYDNTGSAKPDATMYADGEQVSIDVTGAPGTTIDWGIIVDVDFMIGPFPV